MTLVRMIFQWFVKDSISKQRIEHLSLLFRQSKRKKERKKDEPLSSSFVELRRITRISHQRLWRSSLLISCRQRLKLSLGRSFSIHRTIDIINGIRNLNNRSNIQQRHKMIELGGDECSTTKTNEMEEDEERRTHNHQDTSKNNSLSLDFVVVVDDEDFNQLK